LKDRLENSGAVVLGPVGRLLKALELARTADFDVAILDIDINGEPVYPVAYVLQNRGIPYILTTGFGGTGLPPDIDSERLLEKPINYVELTRCIASAVC